MFNLAVIGCGDWSKVIAKNIINNHHFNLISFLCKKQKKIEEFKDVDVFNDLVVMLKTKQIDCLYIAANPKVNFDIYHLINKKQIPVIFEKPMVSKYEQAKIIEKSCSRMTYPVMVNLPILYDNNFKYIQDFFNKNYNKIKRIIILEGGNGPFRKDINPIWDWGSHPLAFILKLLQKDLLIKYVCNEIKNNNSKNKGLICRFNLYFSSGINVKIITGNLFNKKIRKLKILLEDSKFFEYNIIANSILINNKVIDLNLKKDQTIQSLLNQFYLNIKNGYQNKQFENLKISTQSIRILENFYKC